MTAPTAAKALVAPLAGLTYGVADPAVLGAVPATSITPLYRRTIRYPTATATMTHRSWLRYEPPLGRGERARLTPDDCGVCGAMDHRRRDRFRYQVHGFDTPATQTVPTIDAITPWRRRAPAKVQRTEYLPCAQRSTTTTASTAVRRSPECCRQWTESYGSRTPSPRRCRRPCPRQGEPRARESRRQPIRSNT